MPISIPHRRRRALTVASVLVLTACGTGDATADGVRSGAGVGSGGAVEETADLSPKEAAERNTPLLEAPDDVRDVQVLSVIDGSITTLREAATGDRAILLWFWAPH